MKRKTVNTPKRSKEMPVTVIMMDEMEGRLSHKIEGVRDELKSEMHGIRSEIHEMKSEIHGIKADLHGVKSEIQAVKSEVQAVKSEVHALKSEIHGMKSEVHGLKSEFHRVALLVEEQNARNKFVMDGYTQIYELLTREREF
jgi:archaellum component FlaC